MNRLKVNHGGEVRALEACASDSSHDSDDRQTQKLPRRVTGFRAIVYWVLATFFFILAMLGVVLPGIPTTPFLLVMCYFLIRVSPTLHEWALRWPVVGVPLRDWRDQGGVRPSVKILACAMVTLLVGSTLLWSTLLLTVKAVILSAAVYGVSIVLRLPSARSLPSQSSDSN